MLKINNLQANCGDSFLIEDTDSSTKLLIDCGFKLTYRQRIKTVTSDADYIILTHSDEDHIHGAIPLIQDTPEQFSIGKVYVNLPSSYDVKSVDGDISIRQAITLENILNDYSIPYEGAKAGDLITVGKNFSLAVISPTQTDLDFYINKYKEVEESSFESIPISSSAQVFSLEELSRRKDSYRPKKSDFTNASSIAFILHYKKYRLLFLGDAHPTVITDYLEKNGFSEANRCPFDYVKLSHHGSITSISKKLISLISCSNFILSTNGGKARSKHPSRETLAKLILNEARDISKDISFYFNYPIEDIVAQNGLLVSSEERARYKVKLIEQNEFSLI